MDSPPSTPRLTNPRRRRLASAALLLALAGPAIAAAAEPGPYPNHPLRLIVPFSAGTQLDVAGRLVGRKLAEALGQPVIVENLPGATGNIASEALAKAAPDGYTLLITGSFVTLLPSVMGPNAVDPVAAFAAVTRIADPPVLIVVHPKLNVSTLPELVALARRQPDRIAYATPGVGSMGHLTGTLLASNAGIELLHVPYANSGQAMKDVLSGEVPMYITFLGAVDPYLRGGQLRALAVASKHRMIAWPDVPTVAELGFPEAAVDPWNGIVAPAGTPPAIVERLYREFVRIVQLPDVRAAFLQMGMEPMATSPADFAAEIRAAVTRWPPIVRAARIRPD